MFRTVRVSVETLKMKMGTNNLADFRFLIFSACAEDFKDTK